MLKKNGFTLAEVLVSLAIMGIIAALSLPTLLLNVEKRKVGPALMKAVNTLEASSSLALQMRDARKLSDIKKGGGSSLPLVSNILLEYTKLTPVPYVITTGTAPSGNAYATKDGVIFFDNGVPVEKEGHNVYVVPVDTNGQRGPNKEGKDIFMLYVLMNGLVVPEGSYLYAEKFGGDTWEVGCKSMTATDSGVPTNPKTCAGAIIDNGGRILYNYEAIN